MAEHNRRLLSVIALFGCFSFFNYCYDCFSRRAVVLPNVDQLADQLSLPYVTNN